MFCSMRRQVGIRSTLTAAEVEAIFASAMQQPSRILAVWGMGNDYLRKVSWFVQTPVQHRTVAVCQSQQRVENGFGRHKVLLDVNGDTIVLGLTDSPGSSEGAVRVGQFTTRWGLFAFPVMHLYIRGFLKRLRKADSSARFTYPWSPVRIALWLILLVGVPVTGVLVGGQQQAHALSGGGSPAISTPSTSPLDSGVDPATSSTSNDPSAPASGDNAPTTPPDSAPPGTQPVTATSADVWSGPSDSDTSDGSALYSRTSSLTSGDAVTLQCSVYGRETNSGGSGSSSLWFYTGTGYVSASAFASSAGDGVMACSGTLEKPTIGSAPPDPQKGPFPLYADGPSIDVLATPGGSSITALADGTFVRLVCSSQGPSFDGPTDLQGTPIGSSTDWDQIDFPIAGWVPDALVDSHSQYSAAQAC